MKKKEIWNLSFNIAIVVFDIIGTVLLFTIPLNTWTTPPSFYDGWALLFFTTQSNLMLMLSSIGILICIILKWKKIINKIPSWLIFAKLIITTSTTLTMIAVLCYLPFTSFFKLSEIAALYSYSNTFFHLLAPLFGIITFLLFEDRCKIPWYKVIYCVIPTIVYLIMYLSIALTHIESGGIIQPKYDWYGLSQLGVSLAPLFVLLGIGFTFLFGWCLWLGNNKIYIRQLENNKSTKVISTKGL